MGTTRPVVEEPAGPPPTRLARPWRLLLAAGAVANAGLALALVLDVAPVVERWPWEAGRLTVLFLAGILAAIGAGAAWGAVSGEAGSLPAGFVNLAVTLGGTAGFLLLRVPTQRPLGIALALLALANLGLAVLARRTSHPAGPPLPWPVRGSFLLFTLVLAVVGTALVLQTDGVMPWPLDPETSVVVGWIFLGDACYFAYGVLRPTWPAARAQLWSFLAYDLVLLPPLILHLRDVPDALRPNLWAYLAVLVFSALLALRYVVIDPRTRGWGRPADAVRPGSGAPSGSPPPPPRPHSRPA